MNRKSISILIIEDEPDIRQFISFNLKKNNYKVLTAINGEEGLTITKKHKPDIVILDLMLPGIHGIEVCRLLNNNKYTKKIPIIMLTALGQEENIIKGLEAGADDYITKPFSFKILDARIKSVLRRYLSKRNTTQHESISIEGITINPLKREVKVNKTVVKLTYTEFEILYLFDIFYTKYIKVEIKTADAVVKGQTASSSFKNALTTNELNILVPPHIKEGDKVMINSETLNYVEKAKD